MSGLTPAVFHLCLAFSPDSALIVRVVSRKMRHYSDLFLQWNAERMVSVCSGTRSSLYSLICRNFDNARRRFKFRPERIAIQFHLSVSRSLKSLAFIPEGCPDTILSPQEIILYHNRLENDNLQRVWERFRRQIMASNLQQQEGIPEMIQESTPEARQSPGIETGGGGDCIEFNTIPSPANSIAGAFTRLRCGFLNHFRYIPGVNASVQEIRTWIHADASKPLLRNMSWLNLGHLHLTCIPKEVSLCTALQRLYFTGNQPFSLPQTLFEGLTALHGLYLFGNQLDYLPQSLFLGMTALQTLSLFNNQLTTLPCGIFQGLAALQKLFLFHNLLVSLPNNLFEGLTALQTLRLCNNQLVLFPQSLFQGLTALQWIDLSNNQLVLLPQSLFQGLSALQWIDLSNNQLISLPEHLFEGLTALHRVDLFHNQFVSFPEHLFEGLTALQKLFLYNNRLTSLPQGLFEGLTALQTLHLYGNPRLLIPWEDPPNWQNNIEFPGVMHAFFNYECRSSFARFYQLAAGNSSPEVVRQAFSELPTSIKNAIFGKVWVEAGCPNTADPEWGGTHAFDDMQIFYGALKRYVRESFAALSHDQKNAVYGHLYCLAQTERGTEAVHCSAPNWGQLHAFDNILRLIDALMHLSL